MKYMLLRIDLLLNRIDNKCVKYNFLIHQINIHDNILIELMSLSVVLMSNPFRLFVNSSVLPT